MGAIQVSGGRDSEIGYLLNCIKSSSCTFIRNGKTYSGEKAFNHLKRKLDYAGDSIQNAGQFIEHIATKSSMTGDLYKVQCDGRQVLTSEWLKKELLKYRSKKSVKSE
jgi:hypothetical protein